MVGSDLLVIALVVADDIFFSQPERFAKMDAKLQSLLIDQGKILRVRQTVLTDLKADVGVVGGASGMPAPVVPGQGLIGGDGAILEFADGVPDDFSWHSNC